MVSVALCTFNGEMFIRQQIESLLSQTVLPQEIVICDDRSGDETVSIVENYFALYPGISWKICTNENNLGSSRNFEKAISLCTGEYIFLSDQDDIWHNNKIEKTLAYFEKHPAATLSFSNALLIDEQGRKSNETLLDNSFFKPFMRVNYKQDTLLYWSLLLGNIMTGATMTIRKSAVGRFMPFHFHLGRKLLHDGWIGFTQLASGYVLLIDEVLMQYRTHPGQQIGVVKRARDPFEALVFHGEYIPAYKKEYFQRYLTGFLALNALKRFHPVQPEVEEKISYEYLKSRKSYFDSQGFLERKTRLLKWYLGGKHFITIKDVINL